MQYILSNKDDEENVIESFTCYFNYTTTGHSQMCQTSLYYFFIWRLKFKMDENVFLKVFLMR